MAALPTKFNTITVYDDYLADDGTPLLGSVTVRGHKVRRMVASGLNVVPVAKTYAITSSAQTLDGQSITVGHWEVALPLSVDADVSEPDPYTFTVTLTSTTNPLQASIAEKTVLLTADMGSRVRLSDIADGSSTVVPAAAGYGYATYA